MKKIFTLMAVAVMALAVNAKDYNDKLVLDVTFMGKPQHVEQQSTISVDEVENTDGMYNITLNDFSFAEMSLGDIKIVNVKGNSDSDGFVNFEETERDDVEVELYGKKQTVSVTINEGSRMKDDKLYLNLSIVALEGIVTVDAVFGDNNFIPTGIDNVTTTDNGVEAIYDLSGRKLNEMQKGINIVRKADGTTVKVLKK